jgi:HD-GYP domain-containing protein (c-di-GMP phosphodiesterase class II)
MFFRKKEKINVESLLEIDSDLNEIQDLDMLLERILFEARKVVYADAATIYIKESVMEEGIKKDKLFFKCSQNETLQKALPPGEKLIFSTFSVAIDEKSIAGYCAFTRQLVNIPDAYNLPEGVPYLFGKGFDQKSGYKTTSMLTVPLKSAEGYLLGVIQMINSKGNNKKIIPFSKNDELLISHFAVNATMVLQKAKIMRTMILRMIKMAELRDPKETGPHVNRVAGYAVEIWDRLAVRQKLPKEESDKTKDRMRMASMLHDVGKIAISDRILQKPGKFEPHEYEIMQSHSRHGAALFDDPQSPLDVLSRDIAFTHHENWDGTGYPGGIKGENIPLAGRIVCLADVFDALSSRRVYKEPWNEEDVLNEIRKMRGTKFDPELVDIFFEIFPHIKSIQQRYPDAT